MPKPMVGGIFLLADRSFSYANRLIATGTESIRDVAGQGIESNSRGPQEGESNPGCTYDLPKHDSFNIDLSDDWFTQQVVDLDWMENI